MHPIRPPSQELLDRAAQLHSMPNSGMSAEQARAQVDSHHQEAMEQMNRKPVMGIKMSLAHEATLGYAKLETNHAVSVESKEHFTKLMRQQP